ncbi:MAG: hypothetical protein LBB73_01560 [Dysgonamonadaceae bacterium]|jgi:hypothetical protein|nr:hypothetical protein [Dysgonamonadaceae bacterium]
MDFLAGVNSNWRIALQWRYDISTALRHCELRSSEAIHVYGYGYFRIASPLPPSISTG